MPTLPPPNFIWTGRVPTPSSSRSIRHGRHPRRQHVPPVSNPRGSLRHGEKGPQTFAVLVPQELTPGVVTVDSLGKQDVDNKKMEELRVKTEDNEIDLYLDGNKLMRLVAPAANAEVVREKD